MTGPEIMYVVLFFATISGALWAVWWRIEGKVDRAKEEALKRADAAQQRVDVLSVELAAHRLHTAETYVTKAGMSEQTNQIMRAIESVGSRIDGMNERLDRAFEHPHVPPTPRRRAAT